ncbi:hypothetical protein AXA44_33985 [Rhodococcus sp. SC4]|nr:hypothetical protein AXA44_33985 [Rhodococcus sp. SC4]
MTLGTVRLSSAIRCARSGRDTASAPHPTSPPPDPPTADATAAVELKAALEQLRDAPPRGDFSAFGAALDRLQQAVDACLTSGG